VSTSGYVSFDDIKFNTGTKVFYHEIQALKQVTDLKFVIARGYPGNDIPFIKFELEKWYQFNPFLADYFAAQLVPQEYYGVDLLHLACSPGISLLNTVRPKKYVVHIMAHDRKSSIEEHEKYYGIGSYPFLHNIDPYLSKLLLKHADNSDAIVTASTPAAKWIRENTKARKIVSIPHGADTPNNIKSIPDQFRVGYLGAFGPDKGLIYLIAAWKNFGNNGELLFGGLCSQFMPQLVNQIGGTGYRFLGWLNDISDFYNQISVYVQPSVTEGFGIEVPEAMAYGRPVIVTSTTGASDLITDGVDGFIIPPRDPQAILDKLNYFKNNPSSIIEMGNTARKNSKKFTWDIAEQKYIELYKEILCLIHR